MKRLFPLLLILALAASLVSCTSGGRTVTAGGVSVAFSESIGEFDPAALTFLSSGVTVSRGDTVTATFEYAPDTVSVVCFPSDGEQIEIPASLDAYRLAFIVPDVSGECGFNIEYTIDGTLYNITFKLNIE